jgi:citronellol/citronellal dehydrogenase
VRESAIFRSDLLDRRVVAVVGAGELGAAAALACAEHGASVVGLGPGGDTARDPLDEDALMSALAETAERHGRLDALVVDAAGLFAAALAGGPEPLRAAADAAWVAARAAGNGAMIAAPEGGKIILLAPAAAAGPHAGAARAALENLARTLSIEWARHQVRVTAIHPGSATAPAEVAALVAYLASPAGDYFSGCRFSLGGV